VVCALPKFGLTGLVGAICMFVRPVQAVVVPIAFPSAVDAMVIVAPEFALVARLLGNPTKGLALVLPARTGHIPVTEP
jgi:hypothetical protein